MEKNFLRFSLCRKKKRRIRNHRPKKKNPARMYLFPTFGLGTGFFFPVKDRPALSTVLHCFSPTFLILRNSGHWWDPEGGDRIRQVFSWKACIRIFGEEFDLDIQRSLCHRKSGQQICSGCSQSPNSWLTLPLPKSTSMQTFAHSHLAFPWISGD